MSTNQFNWVAPAPPAFNDPQASFGYSIRGVNITVTGSNEFANYPTGLFGEPRYGIGGMYFDATPNELQNLVISQLDLSTLYVKIDFEFRDANLDVGNFTYEWKHVGGQYQPALLVSPLPTIPGTASFMPYTVYWDIRNEPEFLYENASQNIQFRVTTNNGMLWRALETAPTVVLTDTPPTITSIAPLVAYIREDFVYLPTVFDEQNDIASWSIIGAPIDMTFNSNTGEMRWRPLDDTFDHINFSLTVVDTHGMSNTQNFTVQVMLRNPHLSSDITFARTSNAHNNTGGAYQITRKKGDTGTGS